MAEPAGWRPAALNNGWTYCDRVRAGEQSSRLSDVLANRYRHSSSATWQQRLASGEITLNGFACPDDVEVKTGDWIRWQRPPWVEAPVPDQWEVIHDDGDLLVVNKPSGLPVMPGGGFLCHTLTALLQPSGAKPVHRLGRFTSGLQVCARRPETRAKLSAQLRSHGEIRKTYQALTERIPNLEVGQRLIISSDIVERQHPLLGWIWGPEPSIEERFRRRLSAHSEVELLERRTDGDFVAVTIKTGRPHQIRIHLCQINAQLKGDPLYLKDQSISPTSTPGDGGYSLHAWKLENLGEQKLKLCCLRPLQG